MRDNLTIPGYQWISGEAMMKEAVLPLFQNSLIYQKSDQSYSLFLAEFTNYCIYKKLLHSSFFSSNAQLFGLLNNLSRCRTVDREKCNLSQNHFKLKSMPSGYLYLNNEKTCYVHVSGCHKKSTVATEGCTQIDSSHIDHTKDCVEVDPSTGLLLHVHQESRNINCKRNFCKFAMVHMYRNGIMVDNNVCPHHPKCLARPALSSSRNVLPLQVHEELIDPDHVNENTVLIYTTPGGQVGLVGEGLLFDRLSKVFEFIKDEAFEVMCNVEKFPYNKETQPRNKFIVTAETFQSWIDRGLLIEFTGLTSDEKREIKENKRKEKCIAAENKRERDDNRRIREKEDKKRVRDDKKRVRDDKKREREREKEDKKREKEDRKTEKKREREREKEDKKRERKREKQLNKENEKRIREASKKVYVLSLPLPPFMMPPLPPLVNRNLINNQSPPKKRRHYNNY